MRRQKGIFRNSDTSDPRAVATRHAGSASPLAESTGTGTASVAVDVAGRVGQTVTGDLNLDRSSQVTMLRGDYPTTTAA